LRRFLNGRHSFALIRVIRGQKTTVAQPIDLKIILRYYCFMKIGTKYINVDRDVDKVSNDLRKITGKSGREEFSDKLEMFYGELDGRKFHFYCEKGWFMKAVTPELYGELQESNNNETVIKIDIMAPLSTFIRSIFVLICATCFVVITVIPRWYQNNLFSNIFKIIAAFIYPVKNFGCYFYTLKNMLDDFYLYRDGYYDKYIKR
jgi:hypothetical protein